MKKSQKSSKENPTFTIGELNIILKIDFRDEDLEIKDNSGNDSEKQYYKLEELTKIKSLSFLHKNEETLNRFHLETSNEMLKLLLIGSKNMEKRGLIDYIYILIFQSLRKMKNFLMMFWILSLEDMELPLIKFHYL